MLVVCATGDGNLLLNTNPMPDGRIESRQMESFRKIGKWTKKYGESIYGTRGGPFVAPDSKKRSFNSNRDQFDLPDGNWWGGSTHRDNTVYLHILRWPSDTLILPSIDRKIVSYKVLTNSKATVKQTQDHIVVTVPKDQRDKLDTIIKIEFDKSVADVPKHHQRFEKTGGALESGFLAPPAAAKPYTWFHWMNGNITREGITTDLKAMAEVGIGGVQIFDIGGSHGNEIPAGPVDYGSDEWLDLVKHTASEAKRHGLKFSIHNCAGWASTGGPWIKPQNASQILVFTEVKVEGGKHVTQALPQPTVRENFYRDIAVFAFPTPANDQARLSRWITAALYKTSRLGRQPSLQPGPVDAAITLDSIMNISSHMDKDGKLSWQAPSGSWTILRLGHTATGTKNKTAPESGRGLEIDKLSPEGVDIHWRHGIQPILDHLGTLSGTVFDTMHLDSYEGGFANWTPRFRQEFKTRRGYDPIPYLITLTGRIIKDAPSTERFLWDFRRTIADLYADHYYGYFAKQCRDRGLLFSMEPYRGPFESLKVAAHADIPMGEFWTNKIYVDSLKMASSAAHLHGRPLVSAESFTAGPQDGRWQMHPGSLRRIGDLAWTHGINRFVFHRFTHQPWQDQVPGMTMGQYGSHIDRTNTWWGSSKAWMSYISRSQFLLQQGMCVTDVLHFVGEASPMVSSSRIASLKRAGYDYDLCGTDMVPRLKVENGDVILPSGRRYSLLVLPDTPFQTPNLARKLRDLVRAGATIIGPKPKHNPSLAGFPESEKEVISIGREVWGEIDGKTIKLNRFGKGQVFNGVDPAEVLAKLQVPAAIQIPSSVAGLEWIQRRTDDHIIFFLSNQSDTVIKSVIGFRATGKQVELWDPEQATIRRAPAWTQSDDHIHVPLKLAAGKSIFVIFKASGKAEVDPYVRSEWVGHKQALSPSWTSEFDTYENETILRTWNNGPHSLHRASGSISQIDVHGIPKPKTIAGPWTVRFQAKRGAPAEVKLNKLISWSRHSDPGVRHFSGTATTSIRFELPDSFFKVNQDAWLDLGEVAVIADVRLNNKSLGTLWHPPFRLEVSKVLRPGSNTLEVDVSNLWVNRLIGDEKETADFEWTESYLSRWPDWLNNGKARPSSKRITFTTWKHWNADDQLVPSGLIGPVTLRCARLVPMTTGN